MAENKYPAYDGIKHRVEAALEKLVERDRDLFEVDANERSISHKLAEYLGHEFKGWHVDCEYNRDGHDPKRVHIPTEIVPVRVETDDDKGTTVYPDIIIHQRKTNQNLLCVEMKKATSSADALARDKKKLEAYCAELDYRFSLLVIIEVGEKRPGYCFELLSTQD